MRLLLSAYRVLAITPCDKRRDNMMSYAVVNLAYTQSCYQRDAINTLPARSLRQTRIQLSHANSSGVLDFYSFPEKNL